MPFARMLRAPILRPTPATVRRSLGRVGGAGMRASASDSCTRYDAAWLDREEVLYMKLMPASSFFKELEGEIQHANLDGLVAEENWEALADISRGLSTVFGSKVRLTVDGLDLDLRPPFNPAINGTASNM